MCTFCLNLVVSSFLVLCLDKTEILALRKQQKRWRGPSFLDIRQFTTEVKLAFNCSFNVCLFCIKFHSKTYPKSIQNCLLSITRLCWFRDRFGPHFGMLLEPQNQAQRSTDFEGFGFGWQKDGIE